MTKTITIRLKQYGDNAKMEDVGEILIPDDSPPIKSIEFTTRPDRFYRLGTATVLFEQPNYDTLG